MTFNNYSSGEISCLHKDKCGGCIYQGVSYEEQLKLKESSALQHFRNKNIKIDCYTGIKPSPDIWRYRNKMEYSFGDEEKGGEMTLGLHMRGRFFSVINTDKCLIVDEDFNTIRTAVLEFCKEKGYGHYRKKNHEGLLRHLILRKGERTGELLVNIVTTTQESFDTEDFTEILLKLEVSGNLRNKIVGILHTENDRPADAVIPDRINLLWGREYYMEEILGLKFKVGAFSFFQTNVAAAERLYEDALLLTGNTEDQIIYDLYSGTGTITQALAVKAGHVVGVELIKEAVEMARASAAENGLANCRFIEGDVLQVLDEIGEKPDTIILDPPRAGVAPKTMKKILNFWVKEIVYISCNPATMAENLVIAADYGYKTSSLYLYDNFPFTKHTEALALLRRRTD